MYQDLKYLQFSDKKAVHMFLFFSFRNDQIIVVKRQVNSIHLHGLCVSEQFDLNPTHAMRQQA